MACKVVTKGDPILLVNVYRPEYSAKNKYSVKDFLEEFALLLQDLGSHTLPSMILGDFNLHLELVNEPEDDLPNHKKIDKIDATNFLSLLSDFGFKQLIQDPTHLHKGTLDLLITQDTSYLNEYHVGVKEEICVEV